MIVSRKFTRIADGMRDRAGVTLHVAVHAASSFWFECDTTMATYTGLRRGVHRIVVRRRFQNDPDALKMILFHELVHADQAERIGDKSFFEDYVAQTASTYDLPWEKNDYEQEAWDRTVDAFPECGTSKDEHLERYRKMKL